MSDVPASMSWKQQRKLLKFFVPSIRQNPDWPVIISEGDSWFSFPIHFNTIDHLDEKAGRRISLLRLEANGDRALRIIGGRQKLRLAEYLKRYSVDALLFSGGGNDVVGADLLPLLDEWAPGKSWRDCIDTAATNQRFDQLRSAYLDLVKLRNENRPTCRIYIHAYDWAVPSGIGASMWGIKVGPWMKPNLERKGIDDEDDQRKIIHWLLEKFADMLEEIARQPNVTLVRTQGTLTESEWNDELHPSRKGFEKIASKFRAELAKQFPQTF
jgi:hypothetical protein